jgi:prepilin-type N-terminal cleavage/methylation domain-containing protein/prepilin-type processing-associated H-X9-DG protein
MKNAPKAFTLVELLVVIGIIAILMGILLPVMARAREAANGVKCVANLRSIGQAMQQYLTDNNNFYPASNYYKGLAFAPVTGQVPTQPTQGYVHWSNFLFGDRSKIGTDAPFKSMDGWGIFQCPSLPNGGLPPANTFQGNNDGLTNETANVVDWQAPRLSYTVNEALCPRGIFQPFFSDRNNVRVYKYVRANVVHNSAETILATEIWGTQSAVTTTSLIDGATPVSASRRPVNGIASTSAYNADSAYKLKYSANYVWAQTSDLHTDPQLQVQAGAAIGSTLDWVGRNHGSKKLGSVAADRRSGWDLRVSNFLYVDGHVETKHITETIYPKTQWGDSFYTLNR